MTEAAKPRWGNATCETHGHIFGYEGKCLFCGTPKPAGDAEVASLVKERDALIVQRADWEEASQSSMRCVDRIRAENNELLDRVERLEKALRETEAEAKASCMYVPYQTRLDKVAEIASKAIEDKGE